jgi:hypothetical protein
MIPNHNNAKNNNSKVTAAMLLSLATILAVAGVTTPLAALASAQDPDDGTPDAVTVQPADYDAPKALEEAPSIVSGDNIYIAWSNNDTENGNEEVRFRASTDGGATFSDKINLSNSSDADSSRVEIAGEGDTVVVSWWETNQTSNIPVARISTDAGATFGSMLMLATNGTIASTEE